MLLALLTGKEKLAEIDEVPLGNITMVMKIFNTRNDNGRT
jgi:hypothetical protein